MSSIQQPSNGLLHPLVARAIAENSEQIECAKTIPGIGWVFEMGPVLLRMIVGIVRILLEESVEEEVCAPQDLSSTAVLLPPG